MKEFLFVEKACKLNVTDFINSDIYNINKFFTEILLLRLTPNILYTSFYGNVHFSSMERDFWFTERSVSHINKYVEEFSGRINRIVGFDICCHGYDTQNIMDAEIQPQLVERIRDLINSDSVNWLLTRLEILLYLILLLHLR